MNPLHVTMNIDGYYLLYVENIKTDTCSEYFERSIEDPNNKTTSVKWNY